MGDGMIMLAINRAVKRHGSLRAAARALRIDAGYLSRLRVGFKAQPSAAVLRKLGLRRAPSTYEFIKP
jgi:hypothetical protein